MSTFEAGDLIRLLKPKETASMQKHVGQIFKVLKTWQDGNLEFVRASCTTCSFVLPSSYAWRFEKVGHISFLDYRWVYGDGDG